MIPDSAQDPQAAIEQTTQLGIGAHQDDLEFMAMSAILDCIETPDEFFSGIICTDGRGSARAGEFANLSDQQMVTIRTKEQQQAARLGRYAYIAQMEQGSEAIKSSTGIQALAKRLAVMIQRSQPSVIFTHQPFDKHPTHVAVCSAVVQAIRLLPAEFRPKRLMGCEVWRGLDWLPDDLKMILPIPDQPELISQLLRSFPSQVQGGKRYDRAVEGRWYSNATFSDSHAIDKHQRVSYGVDLGDLLVDDELSLAQFCDSIVEQFRTSVQSMLSDVEEDSSQAEA